MLGNLSGWHLLIIVFLVLLLFGAPKLPGLAKSVGQSMKIFKNEIKSDKTDPDATDATATVPPATTPSTPAAPTPTPAETTTSSAPETHTKP